MPDRRRRPMADHDHDAAVEAFGICPTCATRDHAAGEAARDDALARVAAAAPSPWLDQARAVVRELAADQPEFTSDDVWARLPHPPEPRALGAVIRALAAEGSIVNTGRTRRSTRPECHANPKTVWRAAS